MVTRGSADREEEGGDQRDTSKGSMVEAGQSIIGNASKS
jgi:hypothetical protein